MDQLQDGHEDEPSSFELKDIIFAVQRSKTWIGFLGVVGLCYGVYSAAAKPNEYTSRAKLHLRLGARENITSEDLVGATSSNRLDARAGIEDEIHMLTAPSLYGKLADDIGAEEILRPSDPTRHSTKDVSLPKRLFHTLQAKVLKVEQVSKSDPGAPVNESRRRRAIKKLMKGTSIRAEMGSNVISVYYSSTSKERAQAHLTIILDGFIERHLEQYSMIDDKDAVGAKMNGAMDELDEAQATYFAHLGECNLNDVDDALSGVEQQMRELGSQIFSAGLRRTEIENEVAMLERRFASMPETVSVTIPAVTRPNEERNTALQLKSQYERSKEELQFERNITIQQRNERRDFYDGRIAELEKEIESLEPVRVDKEETIDEIPNEEREAVRLRLEELRSEDESLVTNTEKITESWEELRTSKDSMFNCKFEHLKLTAAIEQRQQDRDWLKRTYDEISGLASIDQQKKSNLTILERANLPAEKSGPGRAKIVLLGLISGLMVGGSLAVARQFLDSKLRYPHVVGRTLGVPVITVVPERRFLRQLRKAPRPQTPQTVGAG